MNFSPMRQTVLSGPINHVTQLPSTFDIGGLHSGYVPVTQNIDNHNPLVVSASRGFNAGGSRDRIGMSTVNLAWPEIPQEEHFSFYLYVDVNNNGTLSAGFTKLEPIYQECGTPSNILDQHTYNILEATMYRGDGHTANPVSRVFLAYGWGSKGQGRITAFRPYAYLGRWTSETFPFPSPNSYVRLESSFLPGHLITARWVAVCLAQDGNYYPGNELPASCFNGYFTEVIDASGYVRIDTAENQAQILNQSGGSFINLTINRWGLKCYLMRSW